MKSGFLLFVFKTERKESKSIRVAKMDIQTIYAARNLPRNELDPTIVETISKLKISFKPPFRRAPIHKRRPVEPDNWRESALVDVVRKVREKDDVDYDEVNAMINKLSKSTYTKLITEVLARIEKRDSMFRLRITTLLFDRGIRQNFFASLMADAYADISKAYPDALTDLSTQIKMFDKLYDTNNVTLIPSSNDSGYNDAVIAWTKQKEMKRGFAVYLSELYSRSLIEEAVMMEIITSVLNDLQETIRLSKTSTNEEHVDALVRFLAAVAPKVPIKEVLRKILLLPRTETPSLNMKSKFALEDAMKWCPR
jgi:hypothetical protein